jgi:hypothetical protein
VSGFGRLAPLPVEIIERITFNVPEYRYNNIKIKATIKFIFLQHITKFATFSTYTGLLYSKNLNNTNITQLEVNKNELKPEIIYSNSDLDKAHILKDNKNKAGVYR